VLGDTHGQEIGDMVIGDGVAITSPSDKSVDATDAVHDARGVVGMAWERDEMLPLFGEALEGGALLVLAVVDDAVEPDGELGAHVLEVAELEPGPERPIAAMARPHRQNACR
jgi:hypothetical protein